MSTTKPRINWIVRPSDINDKEAVEALFRASYGTLLSNDYDSELLEIVIPDLCHARQELLTCNTWYVVEHPETKQIVGCGGWTPKSPFGEDIPHLRHFATHPKFLRKGVARAIWDRTWTDCTEYQASTSSSSSPPPDMEVFSTLTAESLYASLGFEKVKDMIIPISEKYPFPSILMRRPGEK